VDTSTTADDDKQQKPVANGEGSVSVKEGGKGNGNNDKGGG